MTPDKHDILPAYDDQPSRHRVSYTRTVDTGELTEEGEPITRQEGPVVVVFSNTATALAREYAIFDQTRTGSQILADFGIDESPEPDRPAKVPQTVSARASRIALNQFGLRDDVEAAVDAADRDTQDYWRYSQTIGRTHPVVVGMAQQIGLTEQQLDDLFTAADQVDRG